MAKLMMAEKFHQGKIRKEPDRTWALYSEKLSKIFEEIITDGEMLEYCYCEIRSRKFDEAFIKSITTGIPAAIFSDPDIDPNVFLEEYLPKSSPDNPILILGDVGTGKSTYIHHFFKISLKKLKLDKGIDGIIIDLKDKFYPYYELRNYIDKSIDDYLTKNYIIFYEPKIELLAEIFKDEMRSDYSLDEHLKKTDKKQYELTLNKNLRNLKHNLHLYNIARIKYLRNNLHKIIFITLDNVDHHKKDYQEIVFNIARTLIAEYYTPFILTTRYYTFPLAYKHCGLSAFQPRFLNLSLPDTKEMIKKRMDYLFKLKYEDEIATLTKKKYIKMEIRGKIWTIDINEIKNRLHLIIESFMTPKIVEILENLSGYDLRSLLKMVRIALSSEYVYPIEREEKDMAIRILEKDYSKVRYYDFIKAVMLGNNFYYNPLASDSIIIQNMFCNGDKSYKWNNLIRVRLLQCINHFGIEVRINKIYEFMNSIGYDDDMVKKELDKFLKWDLVESPFNEGYDLEEDDIQCVQLTKSGEYYLNTLLAEPTYLDTVKYGTYIDEDDYKEIFGILTDIKKYTVRDRIEARLLSTDAFINYIGKVEGVEKQYIIKHKLSLDNYALLKNIHSMLMLTYNDLKKRVLADATEIEVIL